MRIESDELSVVGADVEAPIRIQELTDLQLLLVGGGIGDTIL